MKIKLYFPNYFMIMLILNAVLHYLAPIKQIIYFPYRAMGILLIILGIYCYFAVFFTFKKEKIDWRPEKMPRKIITSGVFSISRNPMYLGMFLILLGEAVLLGSAITFILPIIFIIGTNYELSSDESKLEKQFGNKYLDYKNKVRRWV